MKTLKKQSTDTSGKVATEYLRVKDEEVKVKAVGGFKLCGKVDWKKATKGYKGGKKDEPKEVDIVESLPKKRPYQKPSRS